MFIVLVIVNLYRLFDLVIYGNWDKLIYVMSIYVFNYMCE